MRYEQLTFTRFVAAISIIVYHFGLDLFPFNSGSFSFLFSQANLGVSYFFILSGFVMMLAYGGRGRISNVLYYMTRLARIYPVYIVALILLTIFYLAKNETVYPLDFGLSFLVIQSWFPAYALTLNTPGWSLVIEFFFYALFPFLFNVIYSKIRIRWLTIFIVLFWIISQIVYHLLMNSGFYKGFPSDSHNFLHYFPLMHLNEFLIGNLGGMILSKIRKKGTERYDGILIVLLIALFLFLKFPMSWNYHNGLMAIIFVPFILLLSLSNGWITRLFKKRPLVFLGEISYGIYILQFPVFFWSKGLLKHLSIGNEYFHFWISFVVLIVASGLSFIYIEAPIRNLVKKRTAFITISKI